LKFFAHDIKTMNLGWGGRLCIEKEQGVECAMSETSCFVGAAREREGQKKSKNPPQRG